jgi:hypothetical protein
MARRRVSQDIKELHTGEPFAQIHKPAYAMPQDIEVKRDYGHVECAEDLVEARAWLPVDAPHMWRVKAGDVQLIQRI